MGAGDRRAVPIRKLVMPAIRLPLLAFVALLALLAGGCAHASGTWVELAGERYQVEVADDQESRARGLMFRESLPDGHGMLFVHEREEWLSYWMKNTLIPLDILYFDAERRLVGQQRQVPPCPPATRCGTYPSQAPAMFVLELNAGEAERIGLQDGMVITFGPGITPVGR